MLRSSTRRRASRAAGLFVFLATGLVSFQARAQSITIFAPNSLPRVDASGNEVQKRPQNLNPEGVSYNDCLANQAIRFSLTVSGFQANGSLQAWASAGGADCGTQVNRQSGASTCWQLVSGIPLQVNPVVDIPVRTLMAGVQSPSNLNSSASVCGTVDLTTVTVYIMYFAPGASSGDATTKTTAQINIDTVGPEPPSGIQTKPGNTRIEVSFNSISGEGGVSSLTGLKAYCTPAASGSAGTTGTTAPVSGSTATTDAGTTIVCNDAGSSEATDASDAEAGDAAGAETDAGCVTVANDAGGTSVSTPAGGACYAPAFVTDSSTGLIPTPSFDSTFECGSVSQSFATSVNATTLNGQPLNNGTVYAVAVAGTDDYGNIGRLSDVHCEMPELTNDFWDTYKNDNGQAGGGFCSTSEPGAPLGGFGVIGVAAAFAVSLVRRRRDRR